ncbi:MBL fold metallo-hydrolase [Telmatospirillum sp. J64-1]|uniref:MBL fold metallo-hydrolase n=1 Tax=Telmatospirillum sp. J64-1 TaxID=2502183 RepID=UPI00115D3F68|nr:MBL fold metallo-hydrolase [Telmatospirillum sp. J64-1]
MATHRPLMIGDFALRIVVTNPPLNQNCYLVEHVPTGERVVLDPGGEAERILKLGQAEGGTVKAIWLTHGHPDHIGATHAIQQALGLPFLAHEDEKPVIAQAAHFAAYLGMRLTPPKLADWRTGEPVLNLGGVEVRMIHTPGHTPGGVCYAFPGFCITGDTLFNHGVGRTDFPGGSQPQLEASITRFLALLPPETILFSGHGPSWTVREARAWWGVDA